MNPIPQLQDFLEAAAARLPLKTALVTRQQRHTYQELDRRSNALAHALVGRGVERGDRVMIFAENGLEAVTGFWAALKASAVAVVVHPQTRAEKLAFLLNDCRAKALITEARLEPVACEAVPRSAHLRTVLVGGRDGAPLALTSPTAACEAMATAIDGADEGAPPPRRNLDVDLAAIVYTSGSTGDPKGVMLSHRNMLTAATSIAGYLEMREDDVVLNVLPLAFDYGLYQMILTFEVGGTLVLERSFAYPAEILSLVVSEGVTGFPGVPTMFAVLAEMTGLGELDLSRVRYVTNTAAALGMKHIQAIRRMFPTARLFSMYGLTECKRCTYLPPEDLDRKPLSVGVAIPNTELWLVDDAGQRVGAGVVGQLVIRGATIMQGYWERPEATARKLRPGPLPGERVLYTGDLCCQDEDGYLYFVARMDDVIKTRGEKVAPREVEQALVEITGVREAAVVGVADEMLGQAVKAFVVLESGASLSSREIMRQCQARLEPSLVPKHLEIVADLPKTPSGKIQKTDLR